MEWSWKKILITLGTFVGIIVLPIYLCSNGMMDYYQKRIDREPNTNFNKWLQIASADVCYKTMRPELSAEYYRRFRDRYKDDPRRPYAFLRYAKSLEDCGRNADAIEEYKRYMEEYPEREDSKEAFNGIDRIKYVKPVK